MNLMSFWPQVQENLKKRIGESSFNTWFSSLSLQQKDDTTILITTPDEFFKKWIIDHYYKDLNEIFNEISQLSVSFEFAIGETITDTTHTLPKIETRKNYPDNCITLNTNFTFENFVVGPSNRFASAASKAVADAPAKAYNPLFIYGKVGLGKTHLLQAITFSIKKNFPNLKICYLTSESFTNDLIDAIRHKSAPDFRKKYRDIDVLLIDDIQFIAGKEATQEEFFHTFNNLHNNHKQIIITSDRPPKEIANLEERLVSRFAWGLTADIQPPDFETRVAILKKKMEFEQHVHIPNDVIFFIAEQIKTNIRELEGALIRVVAYSKLEEMPITLNIAQKVLKDMVIETVKNITVEMVLKEVATYCKTDIQEIKSKKRNKNIVLPRQIAMYLSRQLTQMSLPDIGRAFGGKDHTTVLHACKKIEESLATNTNIKTMIEELTALLKK